MVQIPPKPYESSASPCSLRGPRAMSAGGRQCLGHGFPPHQLLSAILPVSASVGENWRLYLGLSSVTEALCADVAVDLGDKITQARRDRGDGRKGTKRLLPFINVYKLRYRDTIARTRHSSNPGDSRSMGAGSARTNVIQPVMSYEPHVGHVRCGVDISGVLVKAVLSRAHMQK